MGAFTVLAMGLPGLDERLSTGRDFPAPGERESSLNSLSMDNMGSLGSLHLKEDLLCLPRRYCEEWKTSKHLIDHYPNIKAAGRWIVNRLFSGDTVYERGEEPILNQCNIRECLYKLL